MVQVYTCAANEVKKEGLSLTLSFLVFRAPNTYFRSHGLKGGMVVSREGLIGNLLTLFPLFSLM